MCTATYQFSGKSYDVFFSRDDRTDRATAILPERQTDRFGGQYIAPIDSERGGTWFATHTSGVSMALLNGTAQPKHIAKRSRGELIPYVIHCLEINDVLSHLNQLNLTQYGYFHLLVFLPESGCTMISNNGHGFVVTKAPPNPIVSSSFDQSGAESARSTAFSTTVPNDASRQAFDHFHSSHYPNEGPLSVCVHREDVETLSYIRLHVSPERVCLDYVSGLPCLHKEIQYKHSYSCNASDASD